MQLVQDVSDDILGYGPINSMLQDEDVTEIMVNGPERVYVERAGHIELSPAGFLDESHLRRIIDKIVGQIGRRIDESNPMVDARLPDGSRVNAVIHPLAIGGAIPHHPEVLDRSTAGGGPDPFRDPQRSVGSLPAGVRGRPLEHHRLGRNRHR